MQRTQRTQRAQRAQRAQRVRGGCLYGDALGKGHAQRATLLLRKRTAGRLGVDEGALHELGHLDRLRLRAVLRLEDAAHAWWRGGGGSGGGGGDVSERERQADRQSGPSP